MTDWKNVARARQLNIPDADLERIAAALEKLEESFRRLTATIPHDVEPAVIFRAEATE